MSENLSYFWAFRILVEVSCFLPIVAHDLDSLFLQSVSDCQGSLFPPLFTHVLDSLFLLELAFAWGFCLPFKISRHEDRKALSMYRLLRCEFHLASI